VWCLAMGWMCHKIFLFPTDINGDIERAVALISRSGGAVHAHTTTTTTAHATR
jgi:hypothetical protein